MEVLRRTRGRRRDGRSFFDGGLMERKGGMEEVHDNKIRKKHLVHTTSQLASVLDFLLVAVFHLNSLFPYARR